MTNDPSEPFEVVSRQRNTDGAIATALIGLVICTMLWFGALGLIPGNQPNPNPGRKPKPAQSIVVIGILTILSAGPFFLLAKLAFPVETTVELSTNQLRVCKNRTNRDIEPNVKREFDRDNVVSFGLEQAKFATNRHIDRVFVKTRDGDTHFLENHELLFTERESLFDAIHQRWGHEYLDLDNLHQSSLMRLRVAEYRPRTSVGGS